ncbi:exonuclease domain-containing protein [Lachnospiraceae bacterium 29-84]
MSENKGKRLNQYIGDYVVFDLETTGVRPDLDKVIEISALKVKGHQVKDQYSTLVDPGRHIPKAATAINHITDEMVSGAPALFAAMEGFLRFIGDDILVGHNIHTFDLKFIQRDSMQLFGKEIRNSYIDTLFMARMCLPQLSHHRLSDVSEYFGIETKGAHRALQDCVMNQKCYEALGKLLPSHPSDAGSVTCPRCGADMVKRKGMYGEFYGCTDFPNCRGTRNINSKE